MRALHFSPRFDALTHLLRHFSALWQHAPFHHATLPWQSTYPALLEAVLALSDEELLQLEYHPDELMSWIAVRLPGYQNLLPLLNLPAVEGEAALNRFIGAQVPGRKWTQIKAFAQGLTPYVGTTQRYVDWCAGKSHLGRAVANHFGADLHAIERDPVLCEEGKRLAHSFVTQVDYTCCDVLNQNTRFTRDDTVLALHACGDLHRTLVKQWVNSEAKQLVLAPCCYHQWLKANYIPLSQQGQLNNLNLTRDQMRLAVQEVVTAPPRTIVKTQTLKIWRLAFDLIQRDIRAEDAYLPTPSLPDSAVNWGAEAVIRHLAKAKDIVMPEPMNIAVYLTQAEQKFALVRRLQLINHGFRRALELWLVLDLVCYLEEAQCQVWLQTFCQRQVTPRNIQIIATRQQ